MELLIFDFDGLILDTETAAFQLWNSVFQTYGTALPLSRWASRIGTSQQAFNVYDYLESKANQPINIKEVAVTYLEQLLKLIDVLEPRPGVLAYIEDAKSLGIPIALASSGHRDWVMNQLNRLNIADVFHCIRTADDVEKVKPDPEVYQTTLAAMGVKPREAIAFEDSPNDIKAAKAAGVFCVAVPNLVTQPLPLEEADLKIYSMEDISLRELLGKIKLSQK
jgi:beta-phosphoglucomutase-like phosphatase (HAD superfamily)